MEKINYSLEEKKLSVKLCDLLSTDFEILPESEIVKFPGKYLLDGKEHRSIPDLIIKPKKHLIDQYDFVDTIIPVEIKKFTEFETNKYEDLMFQCHSYRFSTFNGIQPKLCLYFIDDYFEINEYYREPKYNNEKAKDPKTIDYQIKKYMQDKKQIETLFGRFGIGEIITSENNYTFRIKRQVLFTKSTSEMTFKPNILNFWWGSNRNSKKLNASNC